MVQPNMDHATKSQNDALGMQLANLIDKITCIDRSISEKRQIFGKLTKELAESPTSSIGNDNTKSIDIDFQSQITNIDEILRGKKRDIAEMELKLEKETSLAECEDKKKSIDVASVEMNTPGVWV